MQAQGIIVSVALFVFGSLHAKAQIMAIESTYNPAGTYYAIPADSTYGWKFTVGSSPISVTQLGFFDVGLNGLFDSHQIGIWDTSGTLLVQATVPAGTAGDLIGAYRFTLVSDTTLSANTSYLIGAHSLLPNDTAIAFDAPQTYASEINYQSASYFGGSGFGAPATSYGAAHGVFGPNFQFVNAIPESEHYSLMAGAGLIVLFAVRKALRKREVAKEQLT
jgi:hypothetical protein